MKKWSLNEIIVFVVAAALPAYLLRFHVGPLPMTVLEVVLIAGIIALITRLPPPFFNGVAMTIRGNLLLFIGALLILIATMIGIVVSPDKTAALGVAKAYFWEPMLLAMLIIAAKPEREKIWRAAMLGLAISAGVVIIYGLIQFILPSLIPATWASERRITSVFAYPNAAALFLAPLVALFLATPLGMIVSGLALVAIALAKSVGGLVAAAAALFFLGLTNKNTRAATIISALAVVLTISLLPQASNLRDQIMLKDWSGRVHQIGWSESVAMLKDHPLFGAGLSGFPMVVKPYHHAQGVEIFQYPHDLFLATWSELGLVGLMGLILTLIWFFRRAYALRAARYVPYLAAAMITILVHGFVDVPYFKNDLAMMFWLFIVLMAL